MTTPKAASVSGWYKPQPPRVKIMDPESGGTIVINRPGTDEPMVTIHPDGTLTIGEGYTPDAAATEFWQAMSHALGMAWMHPAVVCGGPTANGDSPEVPRG